MNGFYIYDIPQKEHVIAITCSSLRKLPRYWCWCMRIDVLWGNRPIYFDFI